MCAAELNDVVIGPYTSRVEMLEWECGVVLSLTT